MAGGHSSGSTRVKEPIFLVGCERSGTTLLRLMLDHHPKVAFNGESDYLVTRVSEDGTVPPVDRFHEWLGGDRIFQASRFAVDTTLDYRTLVNSFLEQKRARDGKDLVGATVHYDFSKLVLIWPRARFIHLFRDGRDVADSMVRLGSWAGNVYVAADWWLRAEQEWDKLRAVLDADAWIDVSFEELIASPGPQLERICAFLGVAYSEKMLGYMESSTYAAPDIRLVQKWRTTMSEIDIRRLEEKLGAWLLRRGYALSGLPGLRTAARTRRYLYLHSRVSMLKARFHRFGAALTIQETLARRFGLRRLHRAALERIHRIINANVK